jgi:hypothetical protein
MRLEGSKLRNLVFILTYFSFIDQFTCTSKKEFPLITQMLSEISKKHLDVGIMDLITCQILLTSCSGLLILLQ